MSNLIQLRRDTAANWSSVNPVLANGEPGYATDTQILKIGNGSTAWNSLVGTNVSSLMGVITLSEQVSQPSVPDPSTLQLYSQKRGGRMVLFIQGPSGLDTPIQHGIYANGMVIVTPSASTAFSTIGSAAPTAVGTVSHPTISATSDLKTGIRRAIVTSAATANSASELRIASNLCYRGDFAGFGGFFMRCRWGMNTAVSLQRTAVGLFGTTSAIATTQSPSALTNCIFMGNDSADTNMQIMHNDGAGNCTKVDLGSSFPANSTTALYDFDLFAAPNSNTVTWRVKNLVNGAVVTGTISTDLPATTTFLTWHAYANNGGTAAAVVLDFYRFYLETDY